MKNICIPLSRKRRQIRRGIPVRPRPDTREHIPTSAEISRRRTPVAPDSEAGAEEKEKIPSIA